MYVDDNNTPTPIWIILPVHFFRKEKECVGVPLPPPRLPLTTHHGAAPACLQCILISNILLIVLKNNLNDKFMKSAIVSLFAT